MTWLDDRDILNLDLGRIDAPITQDYTTVTHKTSPSPTLVKPE